MIRVEMRINPEELTDDEQLEAIRDLLLVQKAKNEAIHDTIYNSMLKLLKDVKLVK